jgi:DNA-binding GntR family transcriptional regulator
MELNCRRKDLVDALVQPKTLVEQAYDAILDAICNGTLSPGERLMQDEVAKRLNVSRQPITGALTMLKSQGFVREAGRRGVVVAPLDQGFVEDIYQLRSAVEPLAVALAIPNITAGDIERGKALIAHGAKMAALNDNRALIQADMEFHSLIYAISGNKLILETMRLNWQHLRRAMGEVLRIPNFSEKVWCEHALIFEAMVSGEEEKASDVMRDHIKTAYQKLKPLLALHGP